MPPPPRGRPPIPGSHPGPPMGSHRRPQAGPPPGCAREDGGAGLPSHPRAERCPLKLPPSTEINSFRGAEDQEARRQDPLSPHTRGTPHTGHTSDAAHTSHSQSRAHTPLPRCAQDGHPWSLCQTLCDPMDCSPPGSSVHGILPAGVLEWVAVPSSRGLPHPGTEPASLTSPALAGRLLTTSGSCAESLRRV